MRNDPLISICIPTYNRSSFLKECLDSIVIQFKDKEIYKKVEIVISDNASPDDTEQVVKKYQKKYKNIRYFRNKKNLGLVRNVMGVTQYALGDYIWFFSDDDLQEEHSLSVALKEVEDKPSVIFCNLSMISKNGEITKRNVLEINKNYVFTDRKDFFGFLNTKFMYTVDWFTTYYSNLIVSRDVLTETVSLLKKFDTDVDVFPHMLGIYYTNTFSNFTVLSNPIVRFRSDNTSWGPSGKLKFLIYWDKALQNHYDNIYKFNKGFIPQSFLGKMKIKNFIRKTRISLIRVGINA